MKLLPHEKAGSLIRILGYLVMIFGALIAAAVILPAILSPEPGVPVATIVLSWSLQQPFLFFSFTWVGL